MVTVDEYLDDDLAVRPAMTIVCDGIQVNKDVIHEGVLLYVIQMLLYKTRM